MSIVHRHLHIIYNVYICNEKHRRVSIKYLLDVQVEMVFEFGIRKSKILSITSVSNVSVESFRIRNKWKRVCHRKIIVNVKSIEFGCCF